MGGTNADLPSPPHANFLKELTAAGIAITPLDHTGNANPVDAIWGDTRPALPQEPVRVHPIRFAGEAVKDKLEKVCFFIFLAKPVSLKRVHGNGGFVLVSSVLVNS